mmetsp:Transcript_16870/g.34730  ORF Transcript_16870/g.34730 Transcript_16870/m.34730 type:complete len:232 (+) Transcript_16870:797-1492(+)
MHDVVTFRSSMQFLDSFSSEHQFGVRLTTLWDFHLDFAIQCFDVHCTSENSLGDRNRSFGVHICTVANEIIIFVDQNLDQQISARSSRIAFRTFSTQTQIHPVVDTGRCIHRDISFFYFNLTIFSIHHLISQMKILRCTFHRFLEGQPDVHLQVCTSLRSSSSACSTAKKGIKQFLRVYFPSSRTAKMETPILKIESSGATEWTVLLLLLKVGVCCGVTKLVVHLPLFVVA